jgi:hypothetical protein
VVQGGHLHGDGSAVRRRVEAWLEVSPGKKAHRQECLCHLERCEAFVMAALITGVQALRSSGQHEAHDERSVVVATASNGVRLQ